MTYNFSVNQVKAIEWKFTPQEAILFDFLFNVPSWAERVTLEGVDFFFIHRTKAIAECPIITDKEDTMYRHFRAIDRKGAIIYKKIDGRDCISLTKKGKTWRKANETGHFRHSEKNPNDLGKKSESNSENFPTDNNNNIDNTNQGIMGKSNSDELTPDSPKKSINGKTTLFDTQEEKPKTVQGKKAKNGKKKKWDTAARNSAKDLFDRCNREWQKNCGLHVEENEGIYWDGKMMGQLTNFMNRLKFKSGTTFFKDDSDFVNRAMGMFLEHAAKLIDAWYMDKFTPTNFVTNFEALYTDVKKNIQNGYTGDKKKNGAQAKIANNAASLQALKELSEEGAY